MADVIQVGPQSYWELNRHEMIEWRLRPSADRATQQSPSRYAVSALRVSIASPKDKG